MKAALKATNLELTPALRTYIEKKLAMMEKYLGKETVIMCQFEVELSTKHHQKGEIYRAEINLELPGNLLRVEKSAEDVKKAVDKVKDHVVELIKRTKEKRIAKRRVSKK